jgi:hypothetical protein
MRPGGGAGLRLRVGGAGCFASCAVLEVHDPHGDLARLRARLAAHGREIRFAPYLPHITVGAFGDSFPPAPIAAALQPWRRAPEIVHVAGAVELVEIDARRAHAPFHVRERIPLGPA